MANELVGHYTCNEPYTNIQCVCVVSSNEKRPLTFPKKLLDDFCRSNPVGDVEVVALCYILKQQKQ